MMEDMLTRDEYQELAYQNIRLSNDAGEQAGIVATNRARSKKTGNPYLLYADADNRDIHENQVLEGLSPKLVKMMATDSPHISYFKDQLPLWNDVVSALEQLNQSPLPKPEPLPQPEPPPQNGYVGSWEEQMQRLEEAGLTGKQNLTLAQRARLAMTAPSVAVEEIRDSLRPNAEAVRQEMRKVERVNALMREFYRTAPGDWKTLGDEQLGRLIQEFGKLRGIPTDDLQPSDFREIGNLTKFDFSGVKGSELVNFLGAVDIFKAAERMMYPELRPANLATVDEHSPLYLQRAKLEMLKEENEALRGVSAGSETLTSFLQSLRLIGEIYATGGMSYFNPKLYWAAGRKLGLKGVLGVARRGIGRAWWSGIKTAPWYAPQSAAEAYNQNYLGQPATIFDEDGIAVTVDDNEATDFAAGLISHLFEHAKEVATENMGELIPGANLLEKGIAKVLGLTATKTVAKSLVAKLGMHPMSRRFTFDVLRKGVPISWLDLLAV